MISHPVKFVHKMEIQQDAQGSKKLIKSKSGLKIVVVNQKQQSPFVLEEPPWTPDKEVTHCVSCKIKFNFTTRKHHCRRCGHIFCKDCCSQREWVPRMCFVDPVRVCTDCVDTCRQETDFFNNSLNILQSGATFLLSPAKSETATFLCLCQMSSTHQCLNFDSAANLPPLAVDSITGYRIFDIPESGSSCLEIKSEAGGLRLTTAPDGHRSAGIAWISAIDRAFRIINVPPVIR